jgi:hypothetical protein
VGIPANSSIEEHEMCLELDHTFPRQWHSQFPDTAVTVKLEMQEPSKSTRVLILDADPLAKQLLLHVDRFRRQLLSADNLPFQSVQGMQ